MPALSTPTVPQHGARTTRRGWRGAPLWLLGVTVAAAAHSAWLAYGTLKTRFERDVARLVFNDNSEALEQAALQSGRGTDRLRAELAAIPARPADSTYLVVSITDRRMWYKRGDSVLFTAPIATGSGKHLVMEAGARVLRFETPRGRLVVQRLDSAPAWIPPDWHYQEQANTRRLGLTQLVRGRPITLRDGGIITVRGNDVVQIGPDGSARSLSAEDGREIVADGKIVIPPYGTRQRRYEGALGSFRLYLGDGYGMHGTNDPSSIGRAVSHGCIRLRNEDIAVLYHRVAVGTPVYIY